MAAPLDDSGWARYFGDATFLYVASRSPHDLPGPYAAAWAKRLDGELAESASPDNVLGRAVREKVIQKPLDVLAGGGALGIGGSLKRPNFVLVLARTAAMDRVLAWAPKAYATGPVTIHEQPVGTAKALELSARGKPLLYAIAEGPVVVLADTTAELAQALTTARTGLRGLTGSRAWGRLRARLRPDAAAVAIAVPGPELTHLADEDPNLAPVAGMLRLSVGALDGCALALAGDAHAQQVDGWFGLDAKSDGYAKLKLGQRAKFYASHPLTLAALVPGDAGLLLQGLQPSYDTHELPMGPGFVGMEGGAGNQQQWEVLKGQLQVFTGLSFDADILPWLGAEHCLFLRAAAGDRVEAATLAKVTDKAAARTALDKAVKHITISQNRQFEELEVGGVKFSAAKPMPQSQMDPALGLVGDAVALATTRAAMEALIQFPLKAQSADPHTRLLAAAGEKKPFLVGWTQGALIARVMRQLEAAAAQAQGRPVRQGMPVPLEGIDTLGLALAMPEADLLHATAQVVEK